jgi:hypothetical protein
MNPPPDQVPAVEEIPHGVQVYTTDGEKVGHVTVSALRDDYFVVLRGRLFTRELFLPRSAIQSIDLKGVTLTLSKAELDDEKWRHPPGESERGKPAEPGSPTLLPTPGVVPPQQGVILLPPVEPEAPLVSL